MVPGVVVTPCLVEIFLAVFTPSFFDVHWVVAGHATYSVVYSLGFEASVWLEYVVDLVGFAVHVV